MCEIEPVIPPTSTRYFAEADYDVYHNPKTRVVFDDARHYLLTTKEKYDVIASDPLDVFVKGTAAIYSKEYFDSVKDHLKPGGMFTLYVPLYDPWIRPIEQQETLTQALKPAFQFAARIEHRFVLDARGDDVTAALRVVSGDAENREVVGFGRPGSPDDFTRLRTWSRV